MKKEKIVSFIMEDDETYIGLKSFYRRYVGVDMNYEQLYANLMNLDGYILGEIIDGSYDDTSPRESIINSHAILLINEQWPCFGDGVEFGKQFKQRLGNAHVAQGYVQVS